MKKYKISQRLWLKASVLSLAISFSFLGNITQASFDYEDEHEIPKWAISAVKSVQEQGIITGFPDGTFRPGEDINRAQAVIMLQRIKKISAEDETGNNNFTDVQSNTWYTKAVVRANREGWVKGYPDGKFHPNRSVNRAEFAMIIQRAFGLDKADLDALDFQDVNPEVWYAEPVANMFACNLIRNENAPNYFPRKNVSRSEAAWVFAQILQQPSLTKGEVDYSSRKTIRKVAIKPRDFNANKQGVEVEKSEMRLTATPKSIEPAITLKTKDWIPVGHLTIENKLEQVAEINTLDFRLKFNQSGVGPADNFEVKIASTRLVSAGNEDKSYEKIAKISKKGDVIFAGLGQEISAEKPTQIEVFIRPLENVQYYFKEGEATLYVNLLEATMFGDLKSENAIKNNRKAPVGYESRNLTSFSFKPIK